MHLKDYYKLLELEPSATLPEIKKAYRRLALLHHPDKTGNDPYSAAQFSDIKEAYEVLTNPAKKEKYLQQRWYDQSTGKRKTQEVITPVSVLKQALELERYASKLDVFRMDKEGLKEYILDLLSPATIEQLKQFNEPAITRQIIDAVIKSANSLQEQQVIPVAERLRQFAGSDSAVNEHINIFADKHRHREQREKYNFLIILIATILLCLLIWIAGH
jgi:molecular chaperone DnaJ